MRRWAFIIALLGMFIMILLLNQQPKKVSDYGDLEELEINTRVKVSGEVIKEKVIYGDKKVLTLGSGIEVVCECEKWFNGKDVEVVGKVSEYEGKRQIEVERIYILS